MVYLCTRFHCVLWYICVPNFTVFMVYLCTRFRGVFVVHLCTKFHSTPSTGSLFIVIKKRCSEFFTKRIRAKASFLESDCSSSTLLRGVMSFCVYVPHVLFDTCVKFRTWDVHVMLLNIWEFSGKTLRTDRTFVVGIMNLHLRVYRRIVWHFDNKERPGECIVRSLVWHILSVLPSAGVFSFGKYPLRVISCLQADGTKFRCLLVLSMLCLPPVLNLGNQQAYFPLAYSRVLPRSFIPPVLQLKLAGWT